MTPQPHPLVSARRGFVSGCLIRERHWSEQRRGTGYYSYSVDICVTVSIQNVPSATVPWHDPLAQIVSQSRTSFISYHVLAMRLILAKPNSSRVSKIELQPCLTSVNWWNWKAVHLSQVSPFSTICALDPAKSIVTCASPSIFFRRDDMYSRSLSHGGSCF